MPIITHRKASGVVGRARAGRTTADKVTIDAAPLGLDVQQRIAAIDQHRLQAYCLERIRAELCRLDYAGALLADPMNIRYATGTRNFAIWTLHSPGRYVLVATEGPVVLFEFAGSRHVSGGAKLVDEFRSSTPWFYFLAGPRTAEKATILADEIVALDRCEPMGTQRLLAGGIELFDAQEVLELARAVKSREEIACLQLSMDVCDIGITRMREALRPGLTENQLWSLLHEANIAHDGEWIECRLLASGGRTNPRVQASSNRVIQAGDMVAFDTDMVGPCGYPPDISRRYVCPGRKPTDAQRRPYDLAQEQLRHNM